MASPALRQKESRDPELGDNSQYGEVPRWTVWAVETFRMPNISIAKRPSLAALQDIETIQGMRPEYVRLPGATRLTGLSRTQLFAAINAGVKSVHFKRPGAQKGIRLIHVQSLMEYIESFGQ